MRHLTTEELEAGLAEIRRSPKDEGVLELIVRRPSVGEREVLQKGELDVAQGLVGDIGASGNVLANWGLHLIDVNLAMGNLLDIVSQQTKAYQTKK